MNRNIYECVFYAQKLGLNFKFQNSKAFVIDYDEDEFDLSKSAHNSELLVGTGNAKFGSPMPSPTPLGIVAVSGGDASVAATAVPVASVVTSVEPCNTTSSAPVIATAVVAPNNKVIIA